MIIMPDGTLVVRAPLRASLRIIQQTVEKHTQWILKHKQKALENSLKSPPRKYLPGEKFLYLGQEYELTVARESDKFLTFDGTHFILGARYAENAREVVGRWYKKEAIRILNERVKLYAKQMGIDYSKLRITNAERRWGSCSPNGHICFSLRLVMAPLPVIDYVVMHELVHIQVKNHSRDFWNRVKTIIPDYKDRKSWLRKNQHLLSL
jgi:hypothetical protein